MPLLHFYHSIEDLGKGLLKGHIKIIQSNRQPQVHQTGHTIVVYPARHDAFKVLQIRLYIN